MALTDDAIGKIKGMIVRGELGPGDRLPPEKQLSDRLGLSRSSLREAVKALEIIRVLDVRRGDGTYVTSLEPDRLLEAISFVIDMQDDRSLIEMLAVRRVLEAHATGQAALAATDTDVAALREELAGLDGDTDVETLVAHDLRFHHAIAYLAGNAYLTSLLENLSSQSVRLRIWRGVTERRAVERTLREHGAIVDAVASRDAELASDLVSAHISGLEQHLRRAGLA